MQAANVFDLTRPSQVTVTCFQRNWTLQLYTAYDWVGSIGYDMDTLVGVLPGAVDDSELDDMWAYCRDTNTDFERRCLNAARVALGRGSGRDWWWSLNLIRRCLQSWPYINGMLLLRGVDAAKLPLPSWLDAAYMLLWENSDDEGRTKLDLELGIPPAGVAVKRAPGSTRAMMQAFAAD